MRTAADDPLDALAPVLARAAAAPLRHQGAGVVVAVIKTVIACSCGAVWRGTFAAIHNPYMERQWAQTHHGLGHEPTTVTKANRARAKAEAQSWREERAR